ncbi:MAG UNVERIFIED_CONTAM: hypothetical protein LVT10_01395 [Anaerolineae bacterium]
MELLNYGVSRVVITNLTGLANGSGTIFSAQRLRTFYAWLSIYRIQWTLKTCWQMEASTSLKIMRVPRSFFRAAKGCGSMTLKAKPI